MIRDIDSSSELITESQYFHKKFSVNVKHHALPVTIQFLQDQRPFNEIRIVYYLINHLKKERRIDFKLRRIFFISKFV